MSVQQLKKNLEVCIFEENEAIEHIDNSMETMKIRRGMHLETMNKYQTMLDEITANEPEQEVR